MALACVMLGFSAATQDIVIDAYRIESASSPNLQALMSATYIAGYRIGMLVSGAGSLYIAGSLGSEMEGHMIIEHGKLLIAAWLSQCSLVSAQRFA